MPRPKVKFECTRCPLHVQLQNSKKDRFLFLTTLVKWDLHSRSEESGCMCFIPDVEENHHPNSRFMKTSFNLIFNFLMSSSPSPVRWLNIYFCKSNIPDIPVDFSDSKSDVSRNLLPAQWHLFLSCLPAFKICCVIINI